MARCYVFCKISRAFSMLCFISLWLSLIPPCTEPPLMNSLNVSDAVSSGSSSQGRELVPEAWGRAGCRASAVRLCRVSKSDIPREKEQFPLQKHSDSFFFPAASQVSVNSRSRAMPSHEVHPSQIMPVQPTHLPPPRAPSWLAHAVPCFGSCCLLCCERIYDLLHLHFQRRLGWRQ